MARRRIAPASGERTSGSPDRSGHPPIGSYGPDVYDDYDLDGPDDYDLDGLDDYGSGHPDEIERELRARTRITSPDGRPVASGPIAPEDLMGGRTAGDRADSSHTAPEREPARLSDLERGFAVDVFEQELRGRQAALYDQHPTDRDYARRLSLDLTTQYVVRLMGGVDAATRNRERFNELFGVANTYSFHTMNDEQWSEGSRDSRGELVNPGYEGLRRAQITHFGHEILDDGSGYADDYEGEEELQSNDESGLGAGERLDNFGIDLNRVRVSLEAREKLERLQREIRDARTRASRAYSDRMRVNPLRRKKAARLTAEMDAAQEDLDELYGERNSILEQEFLDHHNGDAEKSARDLGIVIDGDADTEEKFQRRAMCERSLGARALGWYGNLSLGGKLFVGGFGTVVLSSVTLATGGAGGAAAVAALGGARLARSYATQRSGLYRIPRRERNLEYMHDDGTPMTADELTEASRARRGEVIDKSVRQGDRLKNMTFLMTIGGAACSSLHLLNEAAPVVGEYVDKARAVAGGVARAYTEHIGDYMQGVDEKVGGWMREHSWGPGSDSGGTHVQSESVGPSASPETSQPSGAPAPTATPEATPSAAPETTQATPPSTETANPGTPAPSESAAPAPAAPDAPAPAAPEAPAPGAGDFADARTIDVNEGWMSTFEQSGVANPAEQQALLQNQELMGRLEEMGFAYFDSARGEWGMRLGDGQLSTEAIEAIRESARQSNYTLAG